MLHVLPTQFFINEMPTEYKAKSTNHVFSLFLYNFSTGFLKLCLSQVYIQAQVRKKEIEHKQEVKMTDNVVNTTCVALLIMHAVACRTVRGEH